MAELHTRKTAQNADNALNAEKDEPKSPVKSTEPIYTLQAAIDDISTVIAHEGCAGAGAPNTEITFEQVPEKGTFKYVGGKSFINEGLTHAYVQYGCGSQGAGSLLRYTDRTWKLLNEDARIYPMCSVVRGQDFPTTVVDKCYANDRAADPEPIQQYHVL